jgi:hypothetical protein
MRGKTKPIDDEYNDLRLSTSVSFQTSQGTPREFTSRVAVLFNDRGTAVLELLSTASFIVIPVVVAEDCISLVDWVIGEILGP